MHPSLGGESRLLAVESRDRPVRVPGRLAAGHGTMQRVHSILVWRAERVGDVVMTFPALKVLRSALPGARIVCVATGYARGVLDMSALADRVIEVRFRGGIRNARAYRGLREEIRAGRYDRIFVFAKATKYAKHIGSLADTVHPARGPGEHVAECRARGVRTELGIGQAETPPPCVDLPDCREIAEKLRGLGLDEADRYVVIHAGVNRLMRGESPETARRPPRFWPAARQRELIHRLLADSVGLRVVLVGAGRERERVQEEIMPDFAAEPRLLNLCGRTSLRELYQVLRHARLLVCGDSGVMHVGTMAGSPLVALFGPSDERKTGPFGMGDRATVIRGAPLDESAGWTAMDAIPLERVHAEVAKRIDDGGGENRQAGS